MGTTKVLMLGWEFPPIINGGLGVACLGIAKSLAKQADLSVILPQVDPNYVLDNVDLIGLNQLDVDELKKQLTTTVYESFEKVVKVPVSLQPYTGDESEEEVLVTEVVEKTETSIEEADADKSELDEFNAEDLYGGDIYTRVMQFGKFAARIASQMEFDIIYAHDWMTYLAGVEIKKRTGKPLAIHVHSTSFDRGGASARGAIYDIERYGMEEADLIIPVSEYTAKICEYHFGAPGYKIHPVHNGVSPIESFKTEKAFPDAMVLFLGRLTEQKGPEQFLEIATKVLEKQPNVRFVMAGTGDKLKPLIESGAFQHIGDKFHFTGFLSTEKVHELLSMTDVYCMPSVSEPFGLSALEAAQFGIPAVISKQSGVAEVLHGALKADFWDTSLMADHIVNLINDGSLRAKVTKAGFEDLELLTWDFSVEKVLKLFSNQLQ